MVNRTVSRARMAAQVLHAQLGTDFAHPVDIFGVVQQQGIWLASQPLGRGLYGFYLRQGDVTGIVLNSHHPERLQRYTCAHELGHHVLGHASHVDDKDDILSPADATNELEAQAFAGAFLMPLQALTRVSRRLDIDFAGALEAVDVYAISRELDVSFSAATWQLAALGYVRAADALTWSKQGPAAIKNLLRPGPPPEGNNRASLFILGPSADAMPILCRAGDELRVRLPENASTGHVWRVANPTMPRQPAPALTWDGDTSVVDGATTHTAAGAPSSNEAVLRLVDQRYGSDPSGDDSTVLGRGGTREFVFIADRPGRATLELERAREWEHAASATFSTTVRVGPTHLLDGLARAQSDAYVARVAGG